jgi:catechol 2,3-dioxygenase-like lactoylglutathione lyase family enzyme
MSAETQLGASEPDHATSRGSAVDHVGLSVGDLAAATDFYTKALDLVEEFRFEVPEVTMEAVILRSPDGWAIELMTRPDSTEPPRWQEPHDAVRTRGYGHVCVRVNAELEGWFERFVEAGGRPVVTPRIGPHPQVMFSYAADPEGNLVELVQFLEGFQ